MDLTKELKALLYRHGACLAGIGSLKGIEGCGYDTGVAVAVLLPKNVICDLQEAPTKEYYDLYYSLNDKLNQIVTAGEKFLQEKGFDTYAQTTDRVEIHTDRSTKLPHKTIATRAGLGWIGKNNLLVTEAFGSAVRISSLLTNAPLICDRFIDRSQCGGCSLCVRSCPAQALHGALWEAGMQREVLVDVEKCYKKQTEIMFRETGIETDLCGKCFAVCLYTQKYLRKDSEGNEDIYSGNDILNEDRMPVQSGNKEDIIKWLKKDLTIDRLWEVMELYEDFPFYTMRSLEFAYIIKGNEMFVNRKEKSITKATAGMALSKALQLEGIVSGPKKLGTFGASYLYPIFLYFEIIRQE